MKRVLTFVVICGCFTVAAIAMRAIGQDGPPDGPRGGRAGGPPGREGRGGPGGPGGGFHLIPRFAADAMDLTEDQLKQITELETATKAQLGKILTPEQLKTMEEARPPRPGQGGPGQGGPGREGELGGPPAGLPGDMPPPPFGEEGAGAGPRMDGPRPPASLVVTALDVNDDGTIDADEIAKASESLKKLDKDGDGTLAPEEIHPPRPRGPGGPGGLGGPSRGERQRPVRQRPASEE